jgi:hypothetical protein
MWEHCDTSHDWLDRIGIDDTLLDAWDEKCCFAAFEIVVEIDEESEERRLPPIRRRGVVLVGVCDRIDT